MAKSQRRKGCKPKRAMNPYCIFIKEMRKNKEGRHLGFTDFAKLCANKWKRLSESQKYQYKMKAAADKRRYQNEKKKFGPMSMKMKINKKPMSAFFHFCNYERPKLKAKHPDWTIPQLTRELARKWKYASVNQKLKFKKMADKKRERFKKIAESSRKNMDEVDEQGDSDRSS